MNADPYQELGLPPGAPAAAVTAAYRARAKATHPDRGGAVAAFLAVQRAYEVLSDPERKRRYDDLGRDESELDQKRAAMTELAALLLQFAEREDAEQLDLIGLLRSAVESAQAQNRSGMAAVEKRAKHLRKIAARFRVKGDRPNEFQEVLEHRAAALEQEQRLGERKQAICGHCLVILDGFAYEADTTIASLYEMMARSSLSSSLKSVWGV